MIMIKAAVKGDGKKAAPLAMELWGGHDLSELENEFEKLIASPENALVLLLELYGRPEGFAQCQLRYDYVEGTDSSPVGYLEGIYISEPFRGRGYARQMLERCQSWAVKKGCSEFASDCEISNTQSYNFHIKTGFKEAAKIICFTKKL